MKVEIPFAAIKPLFKVSFSDIFEKKVLNVKIDDESEYAIITVRYYLTDGEVRTIFATLDGWSTYYPSGDYTEIYIRANKG